MFTENRGWLNKCTSQIDRLANLLGRKEHLNDEPNVATKQTEQLGSGDN